MADIVVALSVPNPETGVQLKEKYRDMGDGTHARVVANAGGEGEGGSGDVVGPASATADALALFNGTTGKLLKNGGTLAAALAALGVYASGLRTNTVTLQPADVLSGPRVLVPGVAGYHIVPVSVVPRWSEGEVFYDSAGGLYIGYGNNFLFPTESFTADFLIDPSYLGLGALQNVTTPSPLNAGGNDLTLLSLEPITQRTNGIRTVVINAAGSGYSIGERFGVNGGNGDAEIYVTSVNGGGGVTGTKIWTGGSGYSNGTNVGTSTDIGVGEGATVNITVGASNGVLTVTTIYSLVPQLKTIT